MNILSTFISINPEIKFGKRCITGTRISVNDILQWLASDMTNAEIWKIILLQKDHIRAAIFLLLTGKASPKWRLHSKTATTLNCQ